MANQINNGRYLSPNISLWTLQYRVFCTNFLSLLTEKLGREVGVPGIFKKWCCIAEITVWFIHVYDASF